MFPRTLSTLLVPLSLALAAATTSAAAAAPPEVPTAAFTAAPESGVAPLEVAFSDASTGGVVGWSWDFGDGASSTDPSPTHVYRAPGTFTVTLTVTGQDGADTLVREELVTVGHPAPRAAFDVSSVTGEAPLSVTFTDLSTGVVDSWSWSFGDGAVAAEASPTHVYGSPGTYTVALEVQGPGGADVLTREALVVVVAGAPTADFDPSPSSGVAPLEVSFQDLSSGVVENWAWDFGDGATSAQRAPTHVYERPGSYTVVLTVTGPGGTDARTRASVVQVVERPPTASFAASPTAGTAPLEVAFTDGSGGDVTSWSWDFGDGSGSTDRAPRHVYEQAGTYTVRLTVRGPGGSNSVVREGCVTIVAEPPTAAASVAPRSGTAPLTVQFTDASGGEVDAWTWWFGDGTRSSERSPSHVYGAAGSYAWTLEVTGPGGTATTGGNVVVEPAPLAADLAARPATGGVPLTVAFSDVSTGEVSSVVWDFGDGRTSTDRNPVHVYAEPGVYDVSLTVTGPTGTDTAKRAGLVTATEPVPPVSDFGAVVRVGEAPFEVEFADLSTGDVDTWSWDFGDGTTSGEASPKHTYAAAGAYTVQLTVQGPAGANQRSRTRFVNVVAPNGPATTLGVGQRSPQAVRFTPTSLDFGAARIGTASAPRTVTLANQTNQPLTLSQVFLQGLGAGDFQLSYPGGGAPPTTVPVGGALDVDVVFVPSTLGESSALLRVPTPAVTAPPSFLRVSGVALGASGDDLRVDCLGTTPFVDGNGDVWAPDFGHVGGGWSNTVEAIAGTNDDALYQHQRRATHFAYRLPLLEAGVHEVRLHFAEINGLAEGARRFDVRCEGEVVVGDLDVVAEAGGVATALVVTRHVEVTDGVLDLELTATVGEAALAGIEVVGVPHLDAGVDGHDFGAVAAGATGTHVFTFQNRGVRAATPSALRWSLGESGTAESFTAQWNGTTFAGTSGQVSFPFAPGSIAPGGTLDVAVTFAPALPRFDVASLTVLGDFAPVELEVSGLGGHEGDPYLHVVILAPDVALDYDGDGSEDVVIDCTGSHTHEPGRALVAFEMHVDGALVTTNPLASVPLSVGTHTVDFTITDDGSPTRTITDSAVVDVRPLSHAPGVMLRYFDASGVGASTAIDSLPPTADFAENVAQAAVPAGATIGGSPFTADVVVELVGGFEVPTAGTFAVLPVGGVAQRLWIDGNQVLGAVPLGAGVHTLRARWAVDGLADLPLFLSMFELGVGPFDPSPLFHDLGSVPPVITGMTATGSTSGGNLVVIDGFGFFPSANLTVHWGGTDLFVAGLEHLDPETIRLRTPAAPAGPITVTVETPQGTSNARTFEYDANGPAPIQFQQVLALSCPNPTAGAFGPDGRFYMTALDGQLTAVEFADDWSVLSMVTYPGVSGLSNSDATGIAFDPYDVEQPVRVYVSHGEHYQNGGSSFTGRSDYTGQVSVLVGPTFDTPIPVVTGLPVSNHDHAVNGILFDDAGDLLIAVGSMTNAGVRHPGSGDLPESPLSAAIVRARLGDPEFDGAVQYVESTTGMPNDDQVDGQHVELLDDRFVEVYAAGLRNPFDLVLTTGGRLYATDNGPNVGFGAASTSATTEDPDPYDDDELNLVERGVYYGSPNRNRGRFDDRQNLYRPGSTGESVPHVFRQRSGWLPPSTNGLDEYRSDVFRGAMRGDLVVQQWGSRINRIGMTEDGRRMVSFVPIDPWTGGLALTAGPGGALLSMDYTNGRLRVLAPVEPVSSAVEVADITPWRAPAYGGNTFRIAGRGFGDLSNTSVTIGGLPAALSSVSPRRIVGTYPARPATDGELLDVVVTVGGASDVHEAAVRPLLGRGVERARWEEVTPEVPVALGEVSATELDGILYLVGEGSPATLRFDLEKRQWLSPAAQRPYVGDHHAAEVLDGKLYLVGGFQGGAEGRLQIYDPTTDSWTEGAPMTWAGGSCSTAVIGGKLYAAGGIVNTWTVNNCAVYDPATDAWTTLPAQPSPRNHAAFGTDGQKLWIFGGREGGNFVQNGFANVQVFDPATNTWEDSDDPGSTLAPLPFGRGGMGHAVWFEGEFYVVGGETQTGAGALPGTNVYDRVDVYSPATNTWREATPMPTGRHGVDPFLYDRWIFVPGGGKQAGYANSRVFEGVYLP